MGNVTKLERIHVRIDSDLKERFDDVCARDALNASALIRKWIEDFVKEHERPYASMDILDIVWKLNKDKDESINSVCINVAGRLGYEEDPLELFEDVIMLLTERAAQTGTLKVVNDDHKYGRASVNNEMVYFSLTSGRGLWSTDPQPAWLEPNDIK